MRVLFIGGTGNISSAVSRLAVSKGVDLYLLNRGQQNVDIDGAKTIIGDISKPAELREALENEKWDVAAGVKVPDFAGESVPRPVHSSFWDRKLLPSMVTVSQ